MNDIIINSLFGYFQTLFYINKTIIKLCGFNRGIIDYENNVVDILYATQQLSRVIPYKFDKELKMLVIESKNGLMEFEKELTYLRSYYEKVLSDNYDFLEKVRRIRNKYEHVMHHVNRISHSSGSFLFFSFEFDVENESVCIKAKEFINTIKQINELFSMILEDVEDYLYTKKENSSYCQRITSFNFVDFNKLYDSSDLNIIGKILKDY